MPQQKRISFAGISKQTAKGTPNSTPTYGLGVRGGSTLMVDVNQESDAITFATRISPDENRLAVTPGASVQTRLWPRSGPLLLYGVLGAINTSGAGPFTHVLTPAADLPYLTLFGRLDAEYHEIRDCKIDSLTISWSERSPLEVEYTAMGISTSLYRSAWTPTNDESGQTRFIPPGGTFKLHGRSATAAEAPITGGTITISNNLVPIPLSKSVFPDDVFPAEQVLECSFTTMPNDTTEWRRWLTDADAGTSPSAQPVFGSFDVKFVIDANTDLQIVSTRVAYTGDYPEADPAGGPAELTLAGRVKKPAGDAITATLRNSVASY